MKSGKIVKIMISTPKILSFLWAEKYLLQMITPAAENVKIFH